MFAIVYWCLTVVSLMSSSRADVIRDLTPSSPVLHDNAIELRQRQRCTACEASKEAWGQDLIDQKLQLEKTKLLNKLHLTEPPGVFVNVNDIPTILVQQDPQRSLYNDYTKHPAQKEQDEIESSVFIFDKTLTTGQKVSLTCYDSAGKRCLCFSIYLTSSSFSRRTSRVLLWLYTPLAVGRSKVVSNRTLRIDDIEEKNKATFVASVELGPEDKYVGIDITMYALQWIEQPADRVIRRTLRVRCENCDDTSLRTAPVQASHKPFLEFRRDAGIHRRRRNICSPELYDHCCLKKFYVNFTVIGWNNWIIQPPGYYANYCTGSCRIISSTSYNSIMRNVGNTLDLKGQSYDREIIPCCAPTKMSSLSLLYALEPGKIMKKTISNMIVESCGC